MNMLMILQSDTYSKLPTFVFAALIVRSSHVFQWSKGCSKSQDASKVFTTESEHHLHQRSTATYAGATLLSRESWIAVFRIMNFASPNTMGLMILLLGCNMCLESYYTAFVVIDN